MREDAKELVNFYTKNIKNLEIFYEEKKNIDKDGIPFVVNNYKNLDIQDIDFLGIGGHDHLRNDKYKNSINKTPGFFVNKFYTSYEIPYITRINDFTFNRNKELQGKNFISYKQMKRIKNFFDNFKGNQKEPSFILNGGVEIKNWVNDELRKMRDYIKNTKTNKMDAGMMNQFIDPHEKKDFTNVRTSQEHSRTVDKYNPSVNESVKRINELISKL